MPAAASSGVDDGIDTFVGSEFYLDALLHAECRESFYKYREVIHPGMMWNWWTDELADALQDFCEELVNGDQPIYVLEAPPQHGKSEAVTDFISWFIGKYPEFKVRFASYSDDLGERTNIKLQRIIRGQYFPHIFPNSQIGVPGYQLNLSHIELAKLPIFDQDDDSEQPVPIGEVGGGEFRNATVGGPINGFGHNLGVIDDPHKNRKEANSKLIRQGIWNWLVDDFMPRVDKINGLILIQTRWHTDDAAGRALARLKNLNVREVKFKAIATENERWRTKGAPLFPQHKPLKFLLDRKNAMSDSSWEAQYQQSPYIAGGGRIPVDKIRTVPQWPDKELIQRTVRYYDKAGTGEDEEGGETAAYTSGCLMHLLHDGRYVIEDFNRGRWDAFDRETQIKTTCQNDRRVYKNYKAWVEREPGSGGKESAQNTIAMLVKLNIAAFEDIVSGQGSKEIRAEPFEAAVKGGRVWRVAAGWWYEFKEEAEQWPNGKYKDQIDSAAGAFNKLNAEPGYDPSFSGFQDD